MRGSPFEAGFRSIFSRVRNGDTVNYVDSCSPRPLLVASGINACTVYIVNRVGGCSTLVGRFLSFNNNRFLTVSSKGIGSARLITTLVSRGSGFDSNVQFTRSSVSNAVSVLVVGGSNDLVTTHSGLNELPVVVTRGRANRYMSFRDFTTRGLNCAPYRRLNTNRVISVAASGVRILMGPGGGVGVYSFL